MASRAVLRRIEPGYHVLCAECGERVKFVARAQARSVICNVYVDGKWDRVEHFHENCYREAGHPYGKAAE